MELHFGFRIGEYEVYPRQGKLITPAREFALQAQTMAVLTKLAESAPRTLSRKDLLAELEEGESFQETLGRCIDDLRDALGTAIEVKDENLRLTASPQSLDEQFDDQSSVYKSKSTVVVSDSAISNAEGAMTRDDGTENREEGPMIREENTTTHAAEFTGVTAQPAPIGQEEPAHSALSATERAEVVSPAEAAQHFESAIAASITEVHEASSATNSTPDRQSPASESDSKSPSTEAVEDAGNPSLQSQVQEHCRRSLRPVVVGTLLSSVFILVLAVSSPYWLQLFGVNGAPIASVAVVPFSNMSPLSGDDLLGPGIAEDILNALNRSDKLLVFARESSFQHGEELDANALAKQLEADFVLTGSVTRGDGRAAMTVELVDSETSAPVWTYASEKSEEGLMHMTGEIVAGAGAALGLEDTSGLWLAPVLHPADYEIFLQASQYAYRRAREYILYSNALFDQILERNPEQAPALTGYANNLRTLVLIDIESFHGGYGRARSAAQKAVEANPHYAPAVATLARIELEYRGDLATAVEFMKRALELEPHNQSIVSGAAVLALTSGQVDKAIQMGEQLLRQDPLNPHALANLGLFHLFAGNYADSIDVYQQVLALDSEYVGAHYKIGLAQLLLGRADAALLSFTEELDPEWRTKGMAIALYDLGNMEDHQRAFDQLVTGWGELMPTEIAHVYAWIGDKDTAFEWLTKAVQDEEEGLSTQFQRPLLTSLHDDPRWDTFLERSKTSRRHLQGVGF